MALLWTEPDDVRSRWVGDGLEGVTDGQITTLLEDAEDTVLREFSDLPSRVYETAEPPADATNPIPLRRVKKVVARIVTRHIRNPAGERSRMDVGGPFTQNVVFGGESPGSLYLTDEDRAELGGTTSTEAFTIDNTPTYTGESSPEGWLAHGLTWR